MPENLKRELKETIAQARGVLQDLVELGLGDLYLPALPADLPPCPPGVLGMDRGGSACCRRESLDAVRAEAETCQRCRLAEGRRQVVFGSGNPQASLVLVGEAPGREEDRLGEPFVGESGKLLDRILFAMGLGRQDVYLCNVVKCHPPENRTPEPEECMVCLHWLRRQLAAVQPRVILALGAVAANSLLGDPAPIHQLRGRWFQYEGIALMPTLHPAFLLRHPEAKREVWEDVKAVMKRLREAP